MNNNLSSSRLRTFFRSLGAFICYLAISSAVGAFVTTLFIWRLDFFTSLFLILVVAGFPVAIYKTFKYRSRLLYWNVALGLALGFVVGFLFVGLNQTVYAEHFVPQFIDECEELEHLASCYRMDLLSKTLVSVRCGKSMFAVPLKTIENGQIDTSWCFGG